MVSSAQVVISCHYKRLVLHSDRWLHERGKGRMQLQAREAAIMSEKAELARRIAHRIAPPIVVDAIRAMKKAARSRRGPVADAAGWRLVVSGILRGTRLNVPSGV